MKIFAGVGSRETPKEILELMTKTAETLAKAEYILYSGGADGADTAFEIGSCNVNPQQTVLFLPWNRFNETEHNRDRREKVHSFVCGDNKEMAAIVSKIHPAWSNCSWGAKKLHTRNVAQILGLDLKSPVDFVISWTKGGEMIGGTRTAMKLAEQHDIPIYNLGAKGGIDRLNGLISQITAQGR